MTLNDLMIRARSYVRDINGSIFSKQDLINFINEAIDRSKIIIQLNGMKYLVKLNDYPILMPEQYQYLLSVYCASRCMFQDEQDGRAGILMNEFETKLEELRAKIDNGEIIIKDEDGNIITATYDTDYVKNVYFDIYSNESLFD